MMFTSRELKAFISVAEKKSVKLAADELNISSPAVCSMLKKLEGRINNKLFIFEKNRMTLTQYGERIYTLTNGHFHALKSLEANLKNNKKIIKVFVSKDLGFLSSFIINQFKKISIEVMLTSLIDKSTDVIINDITNQNIQPDNYNSILTQLKLYLVYDESSNSQDVFIHKDYSQLIKKIPLQNSSMKLKIN
ncbi:helix-turn-helix domain-containing protein [Serratia sp. NPDC078593]|uniref:helix-turn-helix domain-containing protein n=1 Tax=unclassified Serratia (in: enterobacteria) TaxID=2647522 RepID=UPI0037D2BAB8